MCHYTNFFQLVHATRRWFRTVAAHLLNRGHQEAAALTRFYIMVTVRSDSVIIHSLFPAVVR
jgi:hypothetical protein